MLQQVHLMCFAGAFQRFRARSAKESAIGRESFVTCSQRTYLKEHSARHVKLRMHKSGAGTLFTVPICETQDGRRDQFVIIKCGVLALP